MSILTKEAARSILEKVVSFVKADECSVTLNGTNEGNVRYARNTINTSGLNSTLTLNIQVSFGKKTGTAAINEFDDASLQKAVRRAEELAQLSPENPEYMSVLPPQNYVESKGYFQSTADITPEYRAEVAAASILPASEKDITAAGFFNDVVSFDALMNSKGLFAYNINSNLDFTVTMRTNDGTGSGWATRDFNDVSRFDVKEASNIAIEKALLSRTPKAIEPGKYTVILEPAAALGLLGPMLFSMGARQADEGRSFLAKKGGGTKLDEKIVDERVTIYSDPLNPDLPSNTWSNDGLPINPTNWVENGVVKNMFYTRYWAEQKGVAPMPFPGAAIMLGGDASLAELIKNTQKGVLVTNLWYIRSVDPQTLLYTGLTRDGTFYIENGQIQYPIKNFRFNESPIIMLNNLEELGKQQRVNGNLIPSMRIRDFTFTSLSDAV